MEKSKINLKSVLILVIFISIVVFIMRMKIKDGKYTSDVVKDLVSPVNGSGVSKPSTNTSGPILADRPMKKGNRGTYVKKLQNKINVILRARNKPTISEDGVFGTETENALYSIIGRKSISYNKYLALIN